MGDKEKSIASIEKCKLCERTGERIRTVFTPAELGAIIASFSVHLNIAYNLYKNKKKSVTEEDIQNGVHCLGKLLLGVPPSMRERAISDINASGVITIEDPACRDQTVH